MTSAARISISPPEVVFEGTIDERLCVPFHITSEVLVSGYDLWTDERDSRILSHYTLLAEHYDLDVVYPGEVRSGEKTLCIIAHTPGRYDGVLIYSSEQANAGVGMWIRLHITGDIPSEGILDFKNVPHTSSFPLLLGSLGVLQLLLCIFLFLLLRF